MTFGGRHILPSAQEWAKSTLVMSLKVLECIKDEHCENGAPCAETFTCGKNSDLPQGNICASDSQCLGADVGCPHGVCVLMSNQRSGSPDEISEMIQYKKYRYAIIPKKASFCLKRDQVRNSRSTCINRDPDGRQLWRKEDQVKCQFGSFYVAEHKGCFPAASEKFPCSTQFTYKDPKTGMGYCLTGSEVQLLRLKISDKFCENVDFSKQEYNLLTMLGIPAENSENHSSEVEPATPDNIEEQPSDTEQSHVYFEPEPLPTTNMNDFADFDMGPHDMFESTSFLDNSEIPSNPPKVHYTSEYHTTKTSGSFSFIVTLSVISFVVLIAAIVLVCFCRRRSKKKSTNQISTPSSVIVSPYEPQANHQVQASNYGNAPPVYEIHPSYSQSNAQYGVKQ